MGEGEECGILGVKGAIDPGGGDVSSAIVASSLLVVVSFGLTFFGGKCPFVSSTLSGVLVGGIAAAYALSAPPVPVEECRGATVLIVGAGAVGGGLLAVCLRVALPLVGMVAAGVAGYQVMEFGFGVAGKEEESLSSFDEILAFWSGVLAFSLVGAALSFSLRRTVSILLSSAVGGMGIAKGATSLFLASGAPLPPWSGMLFFLPFFLLGSIFQMRTRQCSERVVGMLRRDNRSPERVLQGVEDV